MAYPQTSSRPRSLSSMQSFLQQQGIPSYDEQRRQRDPFMTDDRDLSGVLPGQVPYSAAERFSAGRALASDQLTPGSIPGEKTAPAGWQDFADFHNLASRMAAARGNNYSVSLPTGPVGGSPVQRPGAGDTYGVFSSAGPAAASARGGSAADGAPSPYDLLQDPYTQDDPNSPAVKLAQMTAMDQLRNSVEAGRRARLAPDEGTPDFYSRRDTLAAQDRRNDALDSETMSDVGAANYWRNQNPIEAFKNDVTQKNLDLAGGRAQSLEGIRQQAAMQKALFALQNAKDRNEANVAIAELKAIASRAGNLTQYGQDASGLDAAFDQRLGIGGGVPGASAAPSAPPAAPELSQGGRQLPQEGQTGTTADGRKVVRQGGRWVPVQ